MMWEYFYQGNVVARCRRPDDDRPYAGMPVCMVGRRGFAPAENFVVTKFDTDAKTLVLEMAA